MDFYDLLYRGYTGEYQLVSSLYRNGLDAVRPPADMGVDVVSLNLKAQLEDPSTAPETFFFQVKTAATPINDAELGNGLRALTTVQFKLKESEVDLLSKSSDRALVCYVYSNDNDALTDATEAPFLYFWLDGTRIANIRRAGAFFRQPGDAKLTLACQLRKPQSDAGHWYAVVVNERGQQVEEGYLGTVDSDNEATRASDGSNHYSIKGYLDFARRVRNERGEDGEHGERGEHAGETVAADSHAAANNDVESAFASSASGCAEGERTAEPSNTADACTGASMQNLDPSDGLFSHSATKSPASYCASSESYDLDEVPF